MSRKKYSAKSRGTYSEIKTVVCHLAKRYKRFRKTATGRKFEKLAVAVISIAVGIDVTD